jgi:hypothetical protein
MDAEMCFANPLLKVLLAKRGNLEEGASTNWRQTDATKSVHAD